MSVPEPVTAEQDHEANVLIVDDEDDALTLFEGYLNDNYSVETTNYAREALIRIDEETDVVLLDRNLEEYSGDEVLTAIREQGYDVQVAMLTAVKPTEEVSELPFDAYVKKPVSEADVVGVVKSMLRNREAMKAYRDIFRLDAKKDILERADKTDTEEYDEIVDELTEKIEQVVPLMDGMIDKDIRVE